MLRNRKGFTLIELLIVVVIIGILAAIAIPKFGATKDQAKLKSVQSDVRNFMTSQEAYFGTYNTYASAYTDANLSYSVSAGNTVNSSTGNATGFSIAITNASISAGNKVCAVTVGGGGATDGVIACTP